MLRNCLKKLNYLKNYEDRKLDVMLSNSQSVNVVPANNIILKMDLFALSHK